jgi:parallel beta-helix repeat protein
MGPKQSGAIIYSVLRIFSFVIIGLLGSLSEGISQTGALSRPAAAVLLQSDGIHDFGGQVIRCQQGEQVGILATVVVSLTIANAVVEGCEIGIVVSGGANGLPSATNNSTAGAVTQNTKQKWSAHVQAIRLRVTNIGIFLAGNGSTASYNIVGGAKYGIVVTGDDNVLIGNQSNDNRNDGFLITGDRNLLEGNEARGNGGAGIHVARMVPMVGNHHFLSFIQDRGLSNIIRGNTALENKRDLEEFSECMSPPFPPLNNEWSNNTFNTRRPDCIE